MGNDLFTQLMNEHSEEIWRALACPDDVNYSIPAQDLEMAGRIEGDLSAATMKELRSMISWITQKSIGKFNNDCSNV